MQAKATVRILLYGLFHRRNLIIMINVGILGSILLGSWLWPPSYQAESSILVLGRSYPDLLTPTPRPTGYAVVMNPKDEINSEMEVIRSRPVLENVVKALKLDEPKEVKDPGVAGTVRSGLRAVRRGLSDFMLKVGLARKPTKEEAFEGAVNNLQSRLWVDPASDSQIIWIRYRSADPALAAQVVNKVAEEYQLQHLNIYINKAESAFYDEQIKKVEKELKGLQEQLVKIKKDSGIVSFSEQSKAYLKKLETFDSARTNVQKEIIRIRAKVEKIQALRKAKPGLLIPLPELAQEPQMMDLENKLVNLRFQQRTVLQRYTPESRQYKALLEQLATLQAQIRGHVSELLERELSKLRELQSEEMAIEQTVKELKVGLEEMPGTEITIANLEREIDSKQGILGVLAKKYQDTLITQSTDKRLENAKVLSLAAVPLQPLFPKLYLNLAAGVILSVVVSLATAFFLEYWDDSLKMPEDAERYLGLSVFASIPEL